MKFCNKNILSQVGSVFRFIINCRNSDSFKIRMVSLIILNLL